jgi:acyl-CoA thioester hydrolase
VSDAYEKVFEVRWGDVDINGHVRNTSYAEYANNARIGFLQEAGFSVRDLVHADIGPVLFAEQIEYRNEAFIGQPLTVRWQIVAMSADGARWRIFHTFMHPDGTTAATLTSAGAWMSVSLRKLAAPPSEILSLLKTVRSADCELIP